MSRRYYIDPDTGQRVYLPDYLTPIDSTLTEPGQAADAKAVGDALGGKQPTISDLSTIRSGAEAGATAVQPEDLPDIPSPVEKTEAMTQAVGVGSDGKLWTEPAESEVWISKSEDDPPDGDQKIWIIDDEEASGAVIPDISVERISGGVKIIADSISGQTEAVIYDGTSSGIPTVEIAMDQIISMNPITVQFTNEQAMIIDTDDNPLIYLDVSSVGMTSITVNNFVTSDSDYRQLISTGFIFNSTVTGMAINGLLYNRLTKQGVYADKWINPDPFTSDMTREVGIDSYGKLWTKPTEIPESIRYIIVNTDQILSWDPYVIQFTNEQAAILNDTVHTPIVEISYPQSEDRPGWSFVNLFKIGEGSGENAYKRFYDTSFWSNSGELYSKIIEYDPRNKQGVISQYNFKPVEKTDVMTAPVGIDLSTGTLWTTSEIKTITITSSQMSVEYGHQTINFTTEQFSLIARNLPGIFSFDMTDIGVGKVILFGCLSPDDDRVLSSTSIDDGGKCTFVKIRIVGSSGQLSVITMAAYNMEILDDGNYFNSHYVEGALQEIGQKIDGLEDALSSINDGLEGAL